MWYVVLVNCCVFLGGFGYMERLSYESYDECMKKIEYIEEQMEEFNRGYPDAELRCVYGELPDAYDY